MGDWERKGRIPAVGEGGGGWPSAVEAAHSGVAGRRLLQKRGGGKEV